MNKNRPLEDFDWVKATNECTAASMFSKLHELARRDIKTRNTQLENERETEPFIVNEGGDGGEFWVDRTNFEQWKKHIWFKLNTESEIEVKARDEEVFYTVKLDDMGCCKLWSDGQSFDPWQVLKLALEPLLF